MKSIAYSNFLAWKFLIIQCSSLFHRFPGSVWSPNFFSFPTFSKLPNKEKQSIKAPSFLSFFCLCVKTQKFYLVSSFPTIPQQPNGEKLVKPSSIISSTTSKRKRPKIVRLFKIFLNLSATNLPVFQKNKNQKAKNLIFLLRFPTFSQQPSRAKKKVNPNSIISLRTQKKQKRPNNFHLL